MRAKRSDVTAQHRKLLPAVPAPHCFEAQLLRFQPREKRADGLCAGAPPAVWAQNSTSSLQLYLGSRTKCSSELGRPLPQMPSCPEQQLWNALKEKATCPCAQWWPGSKFPRGRRTGSHRVVIPWILETVYNNLTMCNVFYAPLSIKGIPCLLKAFCSTNRWLQFLGSLLKNEDLLRLYNLII